MTAALASTAPARARSGARPKRRPRRVGGAATWAWLLVATLAFKAFVPLLAALSAGMQGKAVADVCAVYGVRLAPAVDRAPVSHALHHMHGAAHAPMAAWGSTPPDRLPANPAEHARDHCALTGLAAGAMLAPTLWELVDWREPAPVGLGVADAVFAPPDASARWLTLRVHAPPARA